MRQFSLASRVIVKVFGIKHKVFGRNIMKYFFGILVIAAGVFMVIKTEWFLENFGHSSWAEEKLGGGGTRLMYKIIGLVLIIGSLLAVTGALGEIMLSVFGRLFGLK